MIELFAIAEHPGPPLPPLAPLRTVPFGGLAAICAPASDTEVSAEALWRHEEIVEALMEDRTLLPVRFGTRLEDDAAAERALAERRAELEVALERVRGGVELSVRALAADPPERPADAGGTGADYLRNKRRATAGQDAVAKAVHEPLAVLARVHVRRPPRPPEALRAAYLVDRASVGGFTRLVARLDERHPELRLLCTGPWPPYSFVER